MIGWLGWCSVLGLFHMVVVYHIVTIVIWSLSNVHPGWRCIGMWLIMRIISWLILPEKRESALPLFEACVAVWGSDGEPWSSSVADDFGSFRSRWYFWSRDLSCLVFWPTAVAVAAIDFRFPLRWLLSCFRLLDYLPFLPKAKKVEMEKRGLFSPRFWIFRVWHIAKSLPKSEGAIFNFCDSDSPGLLSSKYWKRGLPEIEKLGCHAGK